MQKVEIRYVPVEDEQLDDLAAARDFPAGVLPTVYPIATLQNGRYRYAHKVRLDNNGMVLQILTKDGNNRFTVADPSNAFLISTPGKAVQMELRDKFGDRSEYELHLSEVSAPTAQASSVTIPAGKTPQLNIAEVVYIEGTSRTRILEFIGTEDIRPSLKAQAMLYPGRTMSIRSANGDLTFQV